MLALQHLSRCFRNAVLLGRYKHLSLSTPSTVKTDALGMPLEPTWSVHELLSSYPSPELQPATLQKLYKLSALVPPEEGSSKHTTVTKELQEMIRLVEAVRLVDTQGVVVSGRGEEDMDRKHPVNLEDAQKDGYGQELLKDAVRSVDGFYVVETDRTRKSTSES